MAAPWTPTSTTVTTSSLPFALSSEAGERGQLLEQRAEGSRGGGGGALTLSDLEFVGKEQAAEEEEEGDWMVVGGLGAGGEQQQQQERRKPRMSGSVPPPFEEPQSEQEDIHPIRPKSRSFHHSSNPWRRTVSSANAFPSSFSTPVPDGLPSSSSNLLLHHNSSAIPISTSTPLTHLAHHSIPNMLSYSLSALEDQASGLPPPSASLSQPESDPTPRALSPASSFLSAFSSPRSSIFLPSNTSSATSAKPSSPDDQGQPAGDTPFVLGKLFGSGGSGLVREVLDAATKQRLSPPQAVKVILKNNNVTTSRTDPSSQRIAEEILLWSSVATHPNLVPLLSHTSSPLATYLFMPYMPNGSLFDLVKRHREHDRGRSVSGSAMMSSSFRTRAGSTASSTKGVAGLPEGEARRLFTGVVEGLRWLHVEEGIVHGDLKAENVLIDGEGRCRIADFGLAVRYRPSASSLVTLHIDAPFPSPSNSPSTPTPSFTPQPPSSPIKKPKPLYPPFIGGSSVHRAHTISSPHPRLASSPFPSPHHQHHTSPRPPSPPTFPPGSLPYASPELLRPPPHPPTSPSQDIWSLGVLLFFLLTSGTLPFQDGFEPRLQMKIVRGLWELPEGINVGRQAEEVLKGCLEVKTGERWKVEEVKASEWVQGWEEVLPRSRSKSRSRSRQRGGSSFERSRSRGTGARSPRDTNCNLSALPNTPNHSTSPPTVFARRFSLSVDTSHTHIQPRASTSSSPSNSSFSDLPTPTNTNGSRSHSRGRSSHAHARNETGDGSSQLSTGGNPSKSRSRSRGRGFGPNGTVEELERVDEVETSETRGRK